MINVGKKQDSFCIFIDNILWKYTFIRSAKAASAKYVQISTQMFLDVSNC